MTSKADLMKVCIRMATLRLLVSFAGFIYISGTLLAEGVKIDPAGESKGAVETAKRQASGRAGNIETRADSMVYRKEKGVLEARGNVLVKKGDQELSADFVIVNTTTEEADAFGNVVMKRGTEVWRGEKLHYNFGIGAGDASSLAYSSHPFELMAENVARLPDNRIRATGAKVTTCENGFDSPHFKVRAREIVVDPNESIRGKHAVFFFGHVPFFYLPYWYRDLDESTGWRFRAGYESKWGGYLLSSYRYPVGSDGLRGETHLDYRSKRGVAFGQDIGWISDSSQGKAEVYFVNDDQPLDENDSPDKDIDSARYRVKVKNTSTVSDNSLFYLQAQYLSDADMLEDFFEREYNQNAQPDNYAVYSFRQDGHVIDALARVRLNDFYEGVNRLPEVSLNVFRQPLGGSLLYYESQTYLSNLERVFREGDVGNKDYSVFRADSAHLVNYPGRYFGYLNVVPRVGLRGTYYSATKQSTSVDQVTTVLATNTVTGTTTSSAQTNTVVSVSDGPGEFRVRLEFGCEASFKAYRTWGAQESARRHVVEPYLNYTIVPEPGVLPEDLYQFDAVDALGEEHFVKLGVRNKYQKKVEGMPFDLVDVNFYTIVQLLKEGNTDTLQNFYFDGRLQPGPLSLITFDGYYDTGTSELARLNARLEYRGKDWLVLAGEYHYVVNEDNLVSADATFLPNGRWTWNLFGRYEAEDGRIEEEGGYIQRNLDCMSLRTRLSVLPGYTTAAGADVDDEYRISLEFWLTAFPDISISGRHGG